MKPAPKHKNHLAAIHIAFKALGISKDDACALKQAVTGKASAADMTEQQRKRLLAHLSGLQERAALARGETPAYVPKRPAQRPALQRTQADGQDARWGKARALWGALAHAGEVHTDTDAALAAYAKRQTGVDAWRFMNGYQVNTVIESLKSWCVRAGVPTEQKPTTEPTP